MKNNILPIKVNKGHGDTVVLVHGLGYTYKSWSYVLKHIDFTRHRVVALDLLGFGEAPKPRDCRYTVVDHANAVIATIDTLGEKKIAIVGHSMGCVVAIEVARMRPDLVKSLVLIGAPLYKREPRSDWRARIMRSGWLHFKLFTLLKKMPFAVKLGAKVADGAVPFVKGMEITDESWPAYRKSLDNTIMQSDTYRHALVLKTPMIFINGIFDMFIIHKNNRTIARKNSYVRSIATLGSHVMTPRLGKRVARVIDSI